MKLHGLSGNRSFIFCGKTADNIHNTVFKKTEQPDDTVKAVLYTPGCLSCFYFSDRFPHQVAKSGPDILCHTLNNALGTAAIGEK